jgi:LysM repeat protein
VSPARLLAPLALVATAVALFVVVSSAGNGSSGDSSQATPSATATAKPGKTKGKARPKVYVVKSGDTPSAIAQKLHVPLGDLLDANPKADPNGLKPGQKLKLP